jgi:hypothetical protein
MISVHFIKMIKESYIKPQKNKEIVYSAKKKLVWVRIDEEIMQAHSLSNKSGEPAGAVWLPCSGGSTIS